MRVYLRNGSAQTSVRAATLRYKLQVKLSTSPSHTILTLGQPFPTLTLQRQAPGRVARCNAYFLSHWYDSTQKKFSTAQAGIEPRICRARGGRLKHWPKETVS